MEAARRSANAGRPRPENHSARPEVLFLSVAGRACWLQARESGASSNQKKARGGWITSGLFFHCTPDRNSNPLNRSTSRAPSAGNSSAGDACARENAAPGAAARYAAALRSCRSAPVAHHSDAATARALCIPDSNTARCPRQIRAWPLLASKSMRSRHNFDAGCQYMTKSVKRL